MNFIGPLAVIVASLVALSGFIIAKKPELKATFEKIQPYQGFLGVFLLVWGIYDLYHNVLATYVMDKSRFGILWGGIGGMGGDKRAIAPLKKARYRMRGGVLGIGDKNTNSCLKAAAEAAIKQLSGSD